MSSSKKNKAFFGDLDLVTLGLYSALVMIGWLMIYAVNYVPEDPFNFLNFTSSAGKQLFFMAICFAMIFVIMMTEWTFWRSFAPFIYIFTLLLLPGTLIFGREINGALAWYQIGGFSFQPSELAKFGTSLAMAGYLSSTAIDMRRWSTRLTAMGIFLLPLGIILIQQDTGSALVFFSFMIVLYREGLSAAWYVLGLGTAAMVILGLMYDPPAVLAWLAAFFSYRLINQIKDNTRPWWIIFFALVLISLWWRTIFTWIAGQAQIDPATLPNPYYFLLIPHGLLLAAAFGVCYWRKNSLIQRDLQIKLLLFALAGGLVFAANFASTTLLAPHQQQRIKIWLKPSEAAAEARGAAYNLLHSKMAIGSGGFAGKGYLNGNMTRLKYVPEQSTDFIFCTVGEQQGFIGAAGLIILFCMLLYRITVLAERQRSNFTKVYAYCVAGIIFAHFIINIGMTMGLFPIIGIPLPFISYGGSSLIGFSLMIAVLLKLDSHRHQA